MKRTEWRTKKLIEWQKVVDKHGELSMIGARYNGMIGALLIENVAELSGEINDFQAILEEVKNEHP